MQTSLTFTYETNRNWYFLYFFSFLLFSPSYIKIMILSRSLIYSIFEKSNIESSSVWWVFGIQNRQKHRQYEYYIDFEFFWLSASVMKWYLLLIWNWFKMKFEIFMTVSNLTYGEDGLYLQSRSASIREHENINYISIMPLSSAVFFAMAMQTIMKYCVT